MADLAEQPSVLHRDHRLRGEAFEKRYLLFDEWLDIPPVGGDLAEQLSLPTQGNVQRGSDASVKRGAGDRIVDLGPVRDLGEALACQQSLAWMVRTRDVALAQPMCK